MSILIDALARLTHDNSGSLRFLHKTVRNWHDVVLMLTGVKSDVDVVLRDGKHYRIRSEENYIVSDYKGDRLKFFYSTKEERIHAILMTIGEFFDEPHFGLDVKGRNVIDAGAYIADTPIYFALNGAKHVYGFEPYPYSYELAKKNVAANSLGRRITMVNAGCGARNGKLKISKEYKSLAGSEINESVSGKSISIMSLDSIAKKYKLRDAALKVDCEGCEYNIILKSKKETLRKFSRILIEYHYGYEGLEERLKAVGFSVKHTKPEEMKNKNVKDQNMYGGTIFARLK